MMRCGSRKGTKNQISAGLVWEKVLQEEEDAGIRGGEGLFLRVTMHH